MEKLGSQKRPAIVRVQTKARGEEIVALCNSKGWQVIVGIEADKPENMEDVDKLMGKTPEATAAKPPMNPVSGNDFCPCGSGQKFKKCCGG
jgi:SWIM/SEC-C metal-binding protein